MADETTGPLPDEGARGHAQPEAEPDRTAAPVSDEQPPRLPFTVVGIGASAGGLEAVGDFLAAMPADGGVAIVLVQHLPPDRESLMAEILARRTVMPVRQAEDGAPVEPNHVYVIRPGHVLTIRDGRLHLGAVLGGPRAANRPVDDFFKSLAEEQRERAICVIMSGMGSNGSAGAQAVKAVGGLCVAQDPETAKFPSMPRHLIDSGNADYILAPQDMPEVLLAYAGHPYARGSGRETEAAAAASRDFGHLRDILTILRNRTRQEFGGYKKPTILRRVQRRMGLSRVTEMEAYVKLLRHSPAEVVALADDLLIHVTGFFRDPDAWETLRERVIVPLIASREPDGDVRCWVTACATGDEAYTLAILLTEEAERAGKPLDIKVFATDMAERTLAHARAGVYPGGIEAEVSEERLRRYFLKEDAVYRVRPELRERVVFAPQNVLQDPPFSRLDIATCRNLLIYLEPEVQQRVLGLLHFGLREGGALFLGTSETVAGTEGMFEPIDRAARIFRRVGQTRHNTVDFPLSAALRTPRGAGTVPSGRSDAGGASLADEHGPKLPLAQVTQRILIERHVPAAVMVDAAGHTLYFQGDTRPYVGQPTGEPTRDLMAMATEGVRSAVRSALRRAAAEGATATVFDGWVETAPGHRTRVAVTASPAGEGRFVVSFGLVGEEPAMSEGVGEPRQDLAEELRRTRDELQSTVEELQTTNEEMRAAAEEASSINEELQSTNEELETSKEEMQSLNEELSTVNAQLQAKMEEHQSTSNDLSSLLASTDIAVLFLDTRLRIRRFTAPVREMFDVIPSDVGRPLSDFARKFTDPDLIDDARAVLERLVPAEREVPASSGRSFIRRITPYRTADDRIDGVVVAFVDVTARVQTAARLAETARLLDLTNDGIIVRDTSNRITYWNRGATELYGYTASEAVGQDLHRLLRTEFELPLEQLLDRLRENDRMTGEIVQVTRDGRRLTLLCRWALDRDAAGRPASILTTTTDITDRKLAEGELARAKNVAEEASRIKDEFMATLSHELRTPLSAILLWAKLLADGRTDPERLDEGLAAILSGAEAQQELIEDLLDMSRITAGKARLQPRQVDLAALVHDAVDTVLPTATAKGVSMTLTAEDQGGTIQADPDRLRQILWNLLSNAVKFTPATGRVEVAVTRADGAVEVTVSDNGQGISPSFLPHVFTPFRQADGSSTRRHGGLGLGLAICRQLVELHGGTITAESEGPGRGATFVVRLPAGTRRSGVAARPDQVRQPPVPTGENAQRAATPGGKTPLAGLSVLLVEDDAGTRSALCLILGHAGAAVTSAASATEALDILARSRPDVLVSDIGLPDTDGYALVAEVRRGDDDGQRPRLPAVALTAFARNEDRRRALATGFDDYLSKPVEQEELVSAVARAAGRPGRLT